MDNANGNKMIVIKEMSDLKEEEELAIKILQSIKNRESTMKKRPEHEIKMWILKPWSYYRTSRYCGVTTYAISPTGVAKYKFHPSGVTKKTTK